MQRCGRLLTRFSLILSNITMCSWHIDTNWKAQVFTVILAYTWHNLNLYWNKLIHRFERRLSGQTDKSKSTSSFASYAGSVMSLCYKSCCLSFFSRSLKSSGDILKQTILIEWRNGLFAIVTLSFLTLRPIQNHFIVSWNMYTWKVGRSDR